MTHPLSALPADVQSSIEMLYLHLNVAISEAPGSGVKGFVPLIEHIKSLGGVFLPNGMATRLSAIHGSRVTS